MAKRNRLEIIKDILEIIKNNDSIKSTPLLRKSNLSSSRFSEYYPELILKGFIQEKVQQGEKKRSITQKGITFLEKYKTIINFIEEFEL